MQSFDDLHNFIKSNDNHKKFVIKSEVPEICKSEPCILGVDEAGRGPVLGPMVYGVTYCPISQKQVLKDLGCADSKALKEEKRDEIVLKMLTEKQPLDNVGWITEVISPNYISNSMYKRAKRSLNRVSMESAIKLIKNVIKLGANIKEIFVDTVGPPETYEDLLCEIFPDITITVAKKADSLYPIVSAASVIAKVTRDHALKVWEFHENVEKKKFGSGYPGDPVTKKFLQRELDRVFGFPLLVRFSWSTTELILKENAVKCRFEDVEGSASKGNKSITSFFSPNNDRKRKRHKFFQERCLTMDNAFQ